MYQSRQVISSLFTANSPFQPRPMVNSIVCSMESASLGARVGWISSKIAGWTDPRSAVLVVDQHGGERRPWRKDRHSLDKPARLLLFFGSERQWADRASLSAPAGRGSRLARSAKRKGGQAIENQQSREMIGFAPLMISTTHGQGCETLHFGLRNEPTSTLARTPHKSGRAPARCPERGDFS